MLGEAARAAESLRKGVVEEDEEEEEEEEAEEEEEEEEEAIAPTKETALAKAWLTFPKKLSMDV